MRTETNRVEIDTPSVMHFDIHEIAECDDKQGAGATALDELAVVNERLEPSGRFPIDQLHPSKRNTIHLTRVLPVLLKLTCVCGTTVPPSKSKIILLRAHQSKSRL